MNKVIIEVTADGWTETLFLKGKEIKKRYRRTSYGSEGLDKSWEYEDSVTDEICEAFQDQRFDELMDALNELTGLEDTNHDEG
mgnify:CR=1 FL=1